MLISREADYFLFKIREKLLNGKPLNEFERKYFRKINYEYLHTDFNCVNEKNASLLSDIIGKIIVIEMLSAKEAAKNA